MLLLQKCTSTATTLCRRVSLTFRITSIPSSPLAIILLLRESKLLIFVVLFLNVIRMLSFRYYFFLLCSFPLHPVLLMVLLVCVFARCCCWHIVTFTILSMQSSRNSLTHMYTYVCMFVSSSSVGNSYSYNYKYIHFFASGRVNLHFKIIKR